MKEGRMESLPKWAREEIYRLRRDLDYERQRFVSAHGAVTPESRVLVGLNVMGPQFSIPDGEQITFRKGPRTQEELYARLVYDKHRSTYYLDVHSGGSEIAVRPRAANSAHIEWGRE